MASQAWAQLEPLPGTETEQPEKPRPGWRFTPTLELRETWTDNIGLTSDADAQSQFISEIAPGFLLDYLGPRVKLRSRYELHYYGLIGSSAKGVNRSSNLANANLQARLLGDFLYLDAFGDISQAGVSPFGQRVYENNYSAVNKAEVRTFRVSPHLKNRLGNFAVSEVRYTRDGVRSNNNTGFGDSDGETLSATLASGSRYQALGWNVSYSRQHLEDSRAQDSDIENIDGRLTLRLGPTLALSAGAGYDKYDYQSLGGATEGRAWLAGVSWNPSRRTSVTADVGHRFFGPSRSLAILHRSRHTVWNLNYNNSVTNSRNEYLLESTLNTASLLDSLFLPTYSDPVERQRAVDAYIRSTGLPAELANDLNFFSNRFYLQRQLRAGVAMRLARTSAIFSLYNVRRDALSVRDADGVLVGSIIQTANDNVTQKGGNLTLNYRYTPRTTFNVVIDRARSESRSALLETSNNFLAVGARYVGRKGLAGSLQLRHVTGRTASGITFFDYTENALSATVYMKF